MRAVFRACLVCGNSTHPGVCRRRVWACGSKARVADPPNKTSRCDVKQHDQPVQEGQADRDFSRRRWPSARRTPRQQRGQHQIRATVQADAGEHLVEQCALRSGERMAAAIFLASRRFADDQGRAGGVALGEHEIAGGIAQGASVEARKGARSSSRLAAWPASASARCAGVRRGWSAARVATTGRIAGSAT